MKGTLSSDEAHEPDRLPVVRARLANREQAKREVDEVVSSDDGKTVADRVISAMEAGQREVDELSETDPVAAAAKAVENNRMNQELISSWMTSNANISAAINNNMAGGTMRWIS